MSTKKECVELLDKLTDLVENVEPNVALNALSGVTAAVLVADDNDGRKFVKNLKRDIRYIQKCQRAGGVEMEA